MATQYFPNETLGQSVAGFRNENLEAQTFNDSEFDIVITQDVFEHLENPEKAAKEIARTLKKGGFHIFTVPLINTKRAFRVLKKMLPEISVKISQKKFMEIPWSLKGVL